MPSKSGKQHRFMEAAAHDPKFARKAGIPQSVGQDFVQADKASGKKFSARSHLRKANAMLKGRGV